MTTPTQSSAEVPAVKPRYSVDGGKDGYELKVELPGVPKEGISVNLDNSVLTIHAKRKSAVPSHWKVLNRELNDLDFVLRLKLNAPVDAEKMSATLENGVLSLRLPVKEAAKPRRIEVQ